MTNSFKKIEEVKEVPGELKGRVMSSIFIGKFIADVADLFTVKYMETIASLFKTNLDHKPDSETDKDKK